MGELSLRRMGKNPVGVYLRKVFTWSKASGTLVQNISYDIGTVIIYGDDIVPDTGNVNLNPTLKNQQMFTIDGSASIAFLVGKFFVDQTSHYCHVDATTYNSIIHTDLFYSISKSTIGYEVNDTYKSGEYNATQAFVPVTGP